MARNYDDQGSIRRYLLNQLSENEQQQIEQRLLTDDELLDQLQAVEDELVDQHLEGALSKDDAGMFEKHFLTTPERQQRLRFAKAFRRYVATHPSERSESIYSQPSKTKDQPNASRSWPQIFSASPLRAAAFVSLILVAGLGVWRVFFYQSDVDKGLLALNSAYREQRPMEARITQFNYAPYLTTRGGEAERVDLRERDRADRILRDAFHDSPGAASYHALGTVYLTNKQFDQAITQFEEALKSDPYNARIIADLGAAWLEKGKISLEKGKSSPTSSESGKGMEELGRSHQYLNKALEFDNALLESLFNRALAEQYLTLYEQAEQNWREYLKRDSTSPWAKEAQQYLKLLEERKARSSGTKKQLLDDFLNAYESRNDDAAWAALSLSRARTGNAIVEAQIDDLLSLEASGRGAEANGKQQILSYAGRIEDQRVQDRFTLDLARVYGASSASLRATLAQARALMKSGVELYNRSEYTQAIDLFSRARELFAKSGDEGESLFAEAWVGYCHLRIPDEGVGLEIFQRLSKIFETRNYRSLFAQSLLAMAGALSDRNEFSKVLEMANRSLAESEQIQDYANAVRCLQSGTSLQLRVGNYRESLTATIHALSLAEVLPPDAKLTWPFYHEASIDYYFLGMPGVALEFENEALRLAITADLPLQTSRSYDRLAVIFEQQKNYGEAFKNSEQARTVAFKITDERAKTNILAHSALNFGSLYKETDNLQKAVDSYDEALALYKSINLDIYQYRARKGKLLALLALGNDVAAEAELASVIYWYEQNREKITEESYRNKFFDTGQNTYDLAVDFQYTRKKDAEKAFDYAESYRARSLLDLMSSSAQIIGGNQSPDLKLASATSALSLAQIQSQLPKQTQLLEYAVMDDKIVMWLVTSSGLKSAKTSITRNELDGLIRSLLRALLHADTRNDDIIRQAKALYSSLISPIESDLDSSRLLCIVPDDNLNFLPFAALVSPTSGRYLIEDYTLQTAPSATVFIGASKQAVQRALDNSERLLAVGNPHFDREQFADFPDLPGAMREAKEIAKLYSAVAMVGNTAIVSLVKQSLMEADVVHLATHALADERSPLQSKLLLSAGGTQDRLTHHASSSVLQASEIYEMKLPHTRLVVLSACQTGIERAYQGEGAVGLARPFIAAGVPLVVASLWPVESESTADLMISFHEHRKQGHFSTVEALRRAQLGILHNQQPGSSSYYGWAAFVSIGGYATF